MALTVSVQPQLLRWARERARLAPSELARRVRLKEAQVLDWETTGRLSLPQLERVASTTHTPIGYLFLAAPPAEALPIADFRTSSLGALRRPSPDLLDTVYLCQRRQQWYRDHLVEEREEALPFVGSASPAEPPPAVARRIGAQLRIESRQRRSVSTLDEALRLTVERVEAARILVMRSGVVGNNTHRKLDVQEFRGFALSDEYAPLVFVNAADSKAAQLFTLAHELGHLWLGQSGVSDANPDSNVAAERYCSAVAAELLVPLEEMRSDWREAADPLEETRRLARVFKVSTQVILIRARDADLLSRQHFNELYAVAEGASHQAPASDGGDFYRTQGSRLGKSFARAVIVSALEGRTTYKEAFQLLGIGKLETFNRLAAALGVSG